MLDLMEGIFGISFFSLFFIGAFYFFYFNSGDRSDKKKLRSGLKKTLITLAIISAISFVIFLAVGSANPRPKSAQEKWDDMAAGYDWGEHSRYNKENHSVEWVPWK